jgi:hypothetical protein
MSDLAIPIEASFHANRLPDFCKKIPRFTEQHLTSENVRNWLRARQGDYMLQLMVYGNKTNHGYEANRVYYKGEFTGTGLCAVSTGVLEQVLNHRYGDNLETQAVRILTDEKDIDTLRYIKLSDYDKFFGQRQHYHHILRFRVKGEEEWQTIDGTYRQYNIVVQPHRMLMIFPSKNERKLYTYQENIERYKETNPEKAALYVPQLLPKNQIHKEYLEELEVNQARTDIRSNETVANYAKLFIPFYN